jgi:sterol 14-demethylase
MGLLATSLEPLVRTILTAPASQLIPCFLLTLAGFAVAWNFIKQLIFYDRSAPPVVFHFFPFWGSTYQYSVDPYRFVTACANRYGDVFTFKSLGHSLTVCLGAEGNRFILEGDPKVISAEAVYRDFSTPVFGKGE